MHPFSGLAAFLPKLCWLTLLFVLASVALPGTSNFVGELMILFGLFQHNAWLAATLALTVILSVIYMLRWMQKVYFGPPQILQEGSFAERLSQGKEDISYKEIAIALPLILLIFWIGLYPAPVLHQISPAIQKIDNMEKTS
jgi:NADH-quinone oxidoreductase subunit M